MLGRTLLAALLLWSLPASAAEEPAALRDAVESGALPPLAERLPDPPRRDLPKRPGWEPGQYGGSLTILDRGGRDPRALVVFGYARLVAWEPDPAGGFRLRPDILESVEAADGGREITLTLRAAHRWSDGEPFTTEDFRFWWEDVINHPELSRGLPAVLTAGGAPPEVTILDERRVRYRWPVPNNRFLPALAGTSPLFIYAPAHYLKTLHPRYADPELLRVAAERAGFRDWAQRFLRLDEPFRFDNPARPTLQPWVNGTEPPAERFVGRRNPFFHRVDGQGRQLPYIDQVILQQTQARLIPAQSAAGQSDLQAVGLSFADAAFLRDAEADGRIALGLWPIGRGAQLALYPNLNAADPDWRALMQSADFRRALSLAVDREEIVSVVYKGFALGGNNSLLPGSPLYREDWRMAWAEHDPARAAALLDGLGLAPGPDGLRRFPDGRRLPLIVEVGETDPAETDILELVAGHWREVGIEMLIRPRSRQAFRDRVQSGEAVMSVFYGLANGLASAAMPPTELAPSGDRQNNWPQWGLWVQSGGEAGIEPDLPVARELIALNRQWDEASDEATRRAAWEELLALHADQVFTIGLVGRVLQPVVSTPRLHNLPEEAPYLYEPGSYFGITRPDTYWLETE